MINNLVGFGMTPTEAKVYLEISKIDEVQIGIIIKKTGLHRGTVYNVISSLIKKGFVGFIDKDGVRYYKISGQNIFDQIIQKRQERNLNEKKQIESFFNTLIKLKEKKDLNEIQVFYGIEAFKALFLEIYKECKKNKIEYLFQGRGGEMMEATGEGFYAYTQKLKKKLKIQCRIILSNETRRLSYRKYTVGNIRYLPTKVYSPINFWIYGDVILLVLFRASPLTIIKIKSNLLSDGFKNYFESLWAISSPSRKR